MTEGKYYWLKLKKDFFKRHDIQIIEAMANGKDYILFYLKMLVESVDHEGELKFNDTIPYNESMLATITNTNVDIVRSAMKVFTELQMIEVLEDKTIFMTEVEKMLGTETHGAERVRKFRNKPIPLQCNTDVTNCNTEIELEKEIELDKDKEIDTKKKTKLPQHEVAINSYTTNEDLKVSINDFIQMRKSIKKPLTDKALDLILKKLDKLASNDNIKIEILNLSVMNSWQGIFELKQESQQKGQYNKNVQAGLDIVKELQEEERRKNNGTI